MICPRCSIEMKLKAEVDEQGKKLPPITHEKMTFACINPRCPMFQRPVEVKRET